MKHIRTSRELIPISDITTVRYENGPRKTPEILIVTRHHLRTGSFTVLKFSSDAHALAALRQIEQLRSEMRDQSTADVLYMRLIDNAGQWSLLSIWGTTSLDSGFHTDSAAARQEFTARALAYDVVTLEGITRD